ncbi:MAG: TIGR02147 family protein [Halobacteriovoraceae bacterium]|nr:TIGR02147 family protein [Halobacteriovoraceae bacterium]MCB9095617.1 TIGR02147 family protein [Halobacteriovoraceae bacterium]
MKKDYRHFLKEIYSCKKKINQSYSLRAYSRDIGVSVSFLSEVLNKKKNLSLGIAQKIAKNLSLDKNKAEFFLLMVSLESASSIEAAELNKKLKKYNDKTVVDLEFMKILSEWYYFAILELTYLENFEPSVAWISQKIGLSEKKTQKAIEKLVSLNVLAIEKGIWRDQLHAMEYRGQTPSRVIRSFHKEILRKAFHAIDQQEFSKRDLGANIMSFSEKNMDEARRIIKNARLEISKLASQDDCKNNVYCLSTQFFSMLEESHEISP